MSADALVNCKKSLWLKGKRAVPISHFFNAEQEAAAFPIHFEVGFLKGDYEMAQMSNLLTLSRKAA